MQRQLFICIKKKIFLVIASTTDYLFSIEVLFMQCIKSTQKVSEVFYDILDVGEQLIRALKKN